MYGTVKDELAATLQEIKDAGLYKNERELTSPQSAHVTTLKADALNFCANNYLGLADDPGVIDASKKALDEWGFGMASVRFICGTQTQHTALERKIADFLGTEATILYSSCFDANGGVFEVLFGEQDAIISDELNHASIIDGVRLSKAMRYRYKNADMADLRAQLEAADGGWRPAQGRRHGRRLLDGRLLCTARRDLRPRRRVPGDGLRRRLACGRLRRRGGSRYAGALRRAGPRRHHHRHAGQGARRRVRRLRRSHQEVVDLLRQRSRPYLFSNSVAPGGRRRVDGRDRPH